MPMPVHLLPSGSGRNESHHCGPQSRPSPPPEEGLPSPAPVLSQQPPLHLRQVLYFEQGSVVLLPGNLLSLGSYLRSEKEQTGDKPSLWPGARGLRGLCGQPGDPAHNSSAS